MSEPTDPPEEPPADNAVPFKASQKSFLKKLKVPKEAAPDAPTTRRGKAVKSKKGEAATFVPGPPAPPKTFDAAEVAEAMNVWWESEGGDNFWVGGEKGWAKWPKDALLDLASMNFFVKKTKRDGEFHSDAVKLLVHLRTHRRIDGVLWGLAGYPSGLHRMPSGEKILVRNGTNPVVPVKGQWPIIKGLIEGRLDDEQVEGEPERPVSVQVTLWHAFHKCALGSLLTGKPGSWTQRRLLVLAGPVGCGKSRLQVMITTGLLGGRVANPKAFLTGNDSFNANLVKAEHLMMEELDNVSQKMVDRLAFSESIKALVANTGVTLRLMRTDPMTINPFWTATLSMNNDPDKLRSFPPLTPDFREKVLMLLVRRSPMPMPTRTDGEKEAFNAAVAAELPAYAFWLLNEFEIPAHLLVDDKGEDATRFGFRDWQHPELARELFDDSPSAELLVIIDEAVFKSGADGPNLGMKLWDLTSHADLKKDEWEDSAADLERLITADGRGGEAAQVCTMHRQALNLTKHHSLTRLLSRLKEDAPNRVRQCRTNSERRWRIFAPVG